MVFVVHQYPSYLRILTKELFKYHIQEICQISTIFYLECLRDPSLAYFFSYFINDMFNLNLYSFINAFADDTVCYRSISSINDTTHFITDIEMLLNWFSSNKLILNENKCVLINFHLNKNILKSLNFLNINNVQYAFSSCVSYLGLSFTHNLTLANQYSLIKSRTYCYLNFLKFLSVYCQNTLYLSFILPNFEYCNIIFLCTNKTHLQKLEKINLKILRLTSLNTSSYTITHRTFKTAGIYIRCIHSKYLYKF